MKNDTIKSILSQAKQHLVVSSDSPTLDAELLLSQVLNCTRTTLHTWPEKTLTQKDIETFLTLVTRRAKGEPIAYLLGYRDFWTLRLKVNKNVLIPRPETELLVDTVLNLLPQDRITIADLGTGSGAIALALASEQPQWHVVAIDNSEQALKLAKDNANTLNLSHIQWLQGHWCDPLTPQAYDAIIANPPYIAADEAELTAADIQFEPMKALISEENGLADIQYISQHAPTYLKPGGYLCLEHGYQQADSVKTLLSDAGFHAITQYADLQGHMRVSVGRYN